MLELAGARLGYASGEEIHRSKGDCSILKDLSLRIIFHFGKFISLIFFLSIPNFWFLSRRPSEHPRRQVRPERRFRIGISILKALNTNNICHSFW